MAYLTVTDDTDTPVRVELDRRAVIGRNPDCTVRLREPHSSRKHAVLYRQDDDWYVRDLNTRNGTKVNGEPVKDCKLHSGDKIAIGKASIVFSLDAAGAGRQAVGDYEILEEIAHSSYARVCRVRRSGQDEVFAMKIFDREAFGAGLGDVFSTIRRVASVSHPHIAAIVEVDPQGEQPYYVSEYVSGKSLAESIGDGPLPVDSVRRISRAVAEGLAAAHARGAVHANLKPRNIIIDESGRTKIVDFGGICPVEPPRSLPSDMAAFAGVPFYVSPEQILRRPVDVRSDMYALGAIIYLMLADSPPFTGDTDESIMKQHLSATPDLSRVAGSGFLADIVGKMLAKEPSERFQSMEEVVKVLESGSVGGVPSASASVTPPKQIASRPGSARSEEGFRMSFFSGVVLILLLLSVFLGAREIGHIAREQFEILRTPPARQAEVGGGDVDR